MTKPTKEPTFEPTDMMISRLTNKPTKKLGQEDAKKPTKEPTFEPTDKTIS